MRVFVEVRKEAFSQETVSVSFEYKGDTTQLTVLGKKIKDGNGKTVFTANSNIKSVSAEIKSGEGVKRRHIHKDLLEVTAPDVQFR